VICPDIYKVNISAYDSIGQTVFAESNESFSLLCPGDSPPAIAVYEPGGTTSQTHVQGDSVEITWFADDDNALPATPINITYGNSTIGWNPISNFEPDDGTYDWDTSSVPCPGTYWVNISVHDSIGQMTFGESNYSFEMICPIGDITGIIADENGDPIPGATVTLRNSTGAVLAVQTTILDGSFEFVDVDQAVNEYNVTAEMQYYVTNSVVDIDVTTGMTTDLGSIMLQTDALINGRIVDMGGSPIPGAAIALLDDGGSVISTTIADAFGNFSFTGLGYGDYRVKANATGYLDNTTSLFSVDKSNLVVPLGDIELNNLGDITGKVVDENGDPVEGATVTLTNSTGVVVGTRTTDANGNFTFRNVTAGTLEYTVSIEMAHYENAYKDDVSVTAGQTENVGTIELVTDATISGRVVGEDGSEIVGAQVELLDEFGNLISTRNTDSNGGYKFTGIGYGTYSLRFSADDFETNTTAQFTVEAGNLEITKNGELSEIEPIEPTGGLQDWWWILLVVIVIIVVVILLLFLLSRRKQEPTEQAPPAAATPIQSEEPPAEGDMQTQEAHPQAGQKVCKNCGSALEPDYIICPHCGKET
jgi:protocatechuate 3,4-dioxygenase beta subunit